VRSGGAPLSLKDESSVPKMDQSYAEVDKLAQEKIKLAERLGVLIQRARTRLDYDLRRVLILQGGEDPGQPAFVSTSRHPVQEINESLRLAIADASPIVPPTPAALPVAQAPALKSRFFNSFLPWKLTSTLYVERKVAATASSASIKLPSPAPTSVPVLPQRTRLAQQQLHRASPARGRQPQPEPEPPGPDEDAEGEDDVEEGNGDEDEDNEDKTLYCFCQKMSYGEVCVSRPNVILYY
jgi:chromatin modification-related protein YNG2